MTPQSQKNLDCVDIPLTLIILGPFQVSVQMEKDEPKNEIAPASTSDKEVGKNESSGKGNQKYFWNFHKSKTKYMEKTRTTYF